ncbi:MAG: hypothetical protein J2O49_08370, partial [Sciscionella sp.]|nr:hypothetical protein [Sciscionella sp.]
MRHGTIPTVQVIVVPTAGGAGRLRILDPPDAIGAVDAIGTVDTIGAVDAISSVDATSTVEGTPNNVADTIGVVEDVPDLAARIRELEHRYRPRWVWPDTTEIYPALLRAGVTLHRCHDLALVE